MNSVFIVEAKYVADYRVFLRFNTGESGEANLKDLIFKYEAAKSLRDPEQFAQFFLDSWPTLAWKCGFDVAPESLYYRLTGNVAPKMEVA